MPDGKPIPNREDLARTDGLQNCVTGLGDPGKDTRLNTYRTYSGQRGVYELEQERIQSWLADREVGQLPFDMFRRGFDITGLDGDQFDLAAIRSHIEGDQRVLPNGSIEEKRGIAWYAWRLRDIGDMLGGCALFPILADGMDPAEPLDVRRIRRVEGWEILDRQEITPWTGKLGINTEPEYYVLSDILSDPVARAGSLRPGDVIHRSRLIIHPGVLLTRREMRNRNWWGASVLEKTMRERAAVEQGTEYSRTYLDRVSWLHMSMAELNELLKAKDELGNDIGEELVRKRMETVRKFARTLGIVVTDGGRAERLAADGQTKIPARSPDKLESVTESSGDLSKLIQLNLDQWGYGTAMPRSIAFGEGPGGLRGGDNKGDWQMYGGKVDAQQTTWGTWVVNRMLIIEFSAKEGPTRGVIPSTWEIKWRPLIIPTPLEQATIDKARAEADNARIDKGVAKPGEVREQRLINGDVEGPLRAKKERAEDTDTAVGPAQVGIATAALTGMIAVASNELEPEALAKWLTSIDDARYPAEQALQIAMAAKREGFPSDQAPGAGVPPVLPTTDDATPAEPEEDDEVDLAYSNDPMPADLRTPRALADEINAATGFTLSPASIHATARRAGLRAWRFNGRPAYSRREIREAYARENEMIGKRAGDAGGPTDVEPEPEPGDDQAPR